MKNSKKILDEKMSACWKKYGAFFAFGNEQFNKKAKKGTTYVSLGSGLICPKNTALEMLKELDKIIADHRQQEIKEKGIEKIIISELYNHEAFYTWSIESTLEALEGYDVTREQVQTLFNQEAQKIDWDNY
jgi:hypothetical protein